MNGPDRRAFVVAAVVLFGVLALALAATALLADPGEPTPESAPSPQDPPSIIVKPNTGQAPEDSGDRGGWEQLALLGIMVVAVGGIGFVAVRGSSAKARAGRERWKAAAHEGDGAVG